MKKRNKKYNPNKIKEALDKKRAERSAIFRWGKDESETVVLIGDDVLKAETQKLRRWDVHVIACFIDSDGDYYERSTVITGDLVKMADDFSRYDKEAQELKNKGNINHFIDTVWFAVLHTPRNTARLDDDEWLKSQAEFRFNNLEKMMARS